MIKNFSTHFMVCAAWVLLSATAAAAVRLPNIISSHMVLQQDIAVPIWGTAEPNEKVTVTFRDQKKTAIADAQGKWMVKLDPLQPGEPTTLTVSGTKTIKLTDVLVGEVWVGSGQSNIDTPVTMYVGHDPALNEAFGKSHPQLRLFRLPQPNIWKEATPENMGSFSAQLFYFGLLLQKELNVPVGLMQGTQGGSPSFPFISEEGFHADPAIQAAILKWDAEHSFEKEQKGYEEALEKWKLDVAAAIAAAPVPSPTPANNPPALSSSNAVIDKAILAKYPKPTPPVRAAEFKTGNLYQTLVRPMIPYAIRGVLWDQGESGTGFHIADQPTLMSALIRSWRKDWGQGEFPWIYVQKPSGRGCALKPSDPVNLGSMPFETLPKDPPQSFNSSHVEGYSIMKEPHTFLSITSDLAPGIHPSNKSGYATRDSKVALGAVYGKSVEYYGPIFQSFKAAGNQIHISYTHAGRGLTVPPNQKLQGFAIAGENQKWHWADAVIEGQTVALSSPDVPSPVAARYWPFAWANLFNNDGLPASGFRTDSWKK